MNLYQQIILESFLSTIMPVNNEIIGYAMRAFGGYDLGAATASAAVGTALAGLFMWCIGRLCSRPFQRMKPERFKHLSAWVNKNGLWLLVFVWLPIGFVIAFAAGLFRIPVRVSVPLFVIGAVGYYAYRFML